MKKAHVNERGKHTTVIESSQDILLAFCKIKDIKVAPGRINAGVGAKSKSVKFKQINLELYEMVVTSKSQRQEFKVFTNKTFAELEFIFKNNKDLKDWNVNYIDISGNI